MFEHPDEIRELASWYRDLAQLGDELDRRWHLKLVDFLEQRATEIEESRTARPIPTPVYYRLQETACSRPEGGELRSNCTPSHSPSEMRSTL